MIWRGSIGAIWIQTRGDILAPSGSGHTPITFKLYSYYIKAHWNLVPNFERRWEMPKIFLFPTNSSPAALLIKQTKSDASDRENFWSKREHSIFNRFKASCQILPIHIDAFVMSGIQNFDSWGMKISTHSISSGETSTAPPPLCLTVKLIFCSSR